MLLCLAIAGIIGQGNLSFDLSEIVSGPELKQATVGIFVKKVNGDTLFELNSQKRLVTASNTKLLTAFLVWNLFGSSSMVSTTAWRVGNNVFIKGGGDPSLSVTELKSIQTELNVKPTDTVYFDDSRFDNEKRVPSWQLEDIETGETAEVTALTVNRGIVEVWMNHGKVELRPLDFGLRVNSTVKNGPDKTNIFLSIGSSVIHVSGTFPDEISEKRLGKIGLPNAGLCAAKIISPKAKRVTGLVPPNEARVYFPKRIHELTSTMLKESNNLFAESLLRLCNEQGNRELSINKIEQLLGHIQIDPTEFRMTDGSGVSRYNEMTPRAIVKLLESMYNRFGQTAVESLARPGEGTLKTRLIGQKVFAKTGTLLGVSCLSGYLATPNGIVAFSIMMNHYACETVEARKLQDMIISRIAKEF